MQYTRRSNRIPGYTWTTLIIIVIAALAIGSSAFAVPFASKRGGSSSSSSDSKVTKPSDDSGSRSSRDSVRPSPRTESSPTVRQTPPRSGVFDRKSGRDSASSDRRTPPADRVYKPSPGPANPGNVYRPSPGSTGRDNNYKPEYRGRDRDYRSNDRDRSRIYTRVGERDQVRNKHRYDSKHSHYYNRGYYRPYSGWRAPRHQSGFYYYTWPYTIEPCHYGFYLWDYDPYYAYRSAYYHYGYFPYIHRNRVTVIDSYPSIYSDLPVYTQYDYGDDDYYLDRYTNGSVREVLVDIQSAWLDQRPELLLRYVRNSENVAVYLDGSYSYSLNGSDYASITRDAIDRIETISLIFNRVISRGGYTTAYATHRFYDANGDSQTLYVSYTFVRSGSNWILTETGSSDRPFSR